MALGDFFRINMPYGIKKNENNEWFAFNREYQPIGFNKRTSETEFKNYPIYTRYKGLTEKKLIELSCKEENTVRRNKEGEIFQIWFYSDGTNPMNAPKCWTTYFSKIKSLSKLKVDTRTI